MTRRLASIDLGTNTARLLIADRAGERLTPVLLEREIVRTGGGFTAERGLSGEAIDRCMACLHRFAASIAREGAGEVRAVATSAVRDAVNGAAFVERVRSETGIRLKVIDGGLEGELTLTGVLSGLEPKHPELLVFDVGGGSTEYTLAVDGAMHFTESLPLGVVRLTESGKDPEEAREKIRRELARLRPLLEGAGPHNGLVLVGSAGTATTLAAIKMEMTDYDYRRVNNSWISKAEVAGIYERLAPIAPAERLKVPGLEKGREDLIVAGMLITLETMDFFGLDGMKVSDYGLLEGLLLAPEF